MPLPLLTPEMMDWMLEIQHKIRALTLDGSPDSKESLINLFRDMTGEQLDMMELAMNVARQMMPGAASTQLPQEILDLFSRRRAEKVVSPTVQ
jgi:hypothetical protein